MSKPMNAKEPWVGIYIGTAIITVAAAAIMTAIISLLSVATARADGPPQRSYVVDLLVSDAVGGKAAAQWGVAIPVTAHAACTLVKTDVARLHYEVQVCQKDDDGPQPLFAFEVRRAGVGVHGDVSETVEAAMRVSVDKRFVVSRVARGPGAETEISAIVRRP